MNNTSLDILGREKDYEQIRQTISWLEHGLRAISSMYDDHSSDKNSKENIFILKDNIYYRLWSAQHLYEMLLREHYSAESYLQRLTSDDRQYLERFIMGNPHFDLIERNVSSIFDSVVFNLVSVFDYISHITCYICNSNKQITFYWTKLAKAARGQNNDIATSKAAKTIDEIDRTFVAGLYDYRSRLIHNKRDTHHFTATRNDQKNEYKILIQISTTAKNYFKSINAGHSDRVYSITFLASWLIKSTGNYIENLLESLVEEIKSNSNLHNNLHGAKGNNRLFLLSINDDNRTARPASEALWEQFKQKKMESF
ncbi:MAG: hypothetical protein JST50_06405 [Bacteroidetes bacterium]|jgi:hypothetical protein|nr:hypothetical protein [Bacteroidota bacterium]